MKHSFITLAGLAACVSGLAVRDVTNRGTTGGAAACSQLLAQYPNITFTQNTTAYSSEVNHIWSNTCILSPSCVFLPSTSQLVAAGLKIISDNGSPFSVRSIGHMPVKGAQSTDNGVFISLLSLNGKQFNANKSIVSIGPGQNWEEVYNFTSAEGLGVNGGRYGQVGVGGLLVGGGIGYFGKRHGWGANSVVSYEVVLANSSIVTVTQDQYSDLWWALKGGNNNFGIVTRYDIKTLPVTSAYAGGLQWHSGAIPAFLDALSDFVSPGGGVEDLDTAINPSIIITPELGKLEASNVVFRAGSDPFPKSLAGFNAIPDAIFNDTTLRPDWVSVPHELNVLLSGTKSRQFFYSVSFKATREAILSTNKTVVDLALNRLGGVTNSSVSWAYQPIPQTWLQAAKDAGGDAIDLDPADGGFIAGLISATWVYEKDDETMYAFGRDAVAAVQQQTTGAGLGYDFIYLNDGGPGQEPYQYYGKGKSLPRLREIYRKYDPQGVFQNLEASAFKLF